MEVILSDTVRERFARMRLHVSDEGIQAICDKDRKRCLSSTDTDDDFSIVTDGQNGRLKIVKVFTPFSANGCEFCPRNK